MLGENSDTTNDQLVAPLFLKKDDSQGRSEKSGRVSPRRPYAFRRGAIQEDRSSKEDIQRQKPLESIAPSFQQRGNIGLRMGLRQFLFALNTHHAYTDAGPDSLRVVKVPSASGWGTQLSLWGPEPPTTDAGRADADLSVRRRSHMRQILEQSAIVNEWGVSETFQPRSWETESPTATVGLDHPDKSVVLNEALREPDVVARWKEYHALFQDNAQTNTQDNIEEIKGRYADKVNQILEAKNILCKQDRDCIEFVVVVDHIRRDHSFQLSDIACELDDLYPHWDFGFQYVSLRTAGQLPLDEYSDLINDG